LYEVTKYIVPVGFGSYVAEDVMMNLDSFKKMPADIQKILLEVGKESEDAQAMLLKKRHDEVNEKMQKAGLKLIEFPDKDRTKWAAQCPDTPAVWAAEMEKEKLPGWDIAKRWQEITAEMGYKWPRKWAVKK